MQVACFTRASHITFRHVHQLVRREPMCLAARHLEVWAKSGLCRKAVYEVQAGCLLKGTTVQPEERGVTRRPSPGNLKKGFTIRCLDGVIRRRSQRPGWTITRKALSCCCFFGSRGFSLDRYSHSSERVEEEAVLVAAAAAAGA